MDSSNIPITHITISKIQGMIKSQVICFFLSKEDSRYKKMNYSCLEKKLAVRLVECFTRYKSD